MIMQDIESRLKKDLVATYFKDGFEDADDLYFYIENILGYSIPRYKFCPEHCAPWDFIQDMFFERVMFSFAFGSRGSGKTLMLALLNHLDMMFKQGSVEVVHAAAHKDQALRGYNYFKNFFTDPVLAAMVVTSIQSKTLLTNGSELEITAGTLKGLNGSHAQKVRIDEAELMPFMLLDEAFSISMSKKSKKSGKLIKAQDCVASTRKTASGTINRLLEEAEEKQMHIYNFCLSGETIVRTPNGDARIRDLVGKEFYVYSVDEHMNLVLRRAKNVRKTREHAEVFETVYEWWAGPKGGKKQGSIVTTPDHLFMLTDGSYIQAQDLCINDSLMPFCKRDMPFQGKNRGWFVGFTGTDSNSLKEAIFVWEQLNGVKLPVGYVVHHKDGNDYNNTPSNLEALPRVQHSYEHTLRWHQEASEEKKQRRNKKISDNITKNNPMSNPEYVRRMVEAKRLAHQKRDNHKVIGMHQYGYQDVYCLEVEETHNFAANDIFVHNCIWENIERCTRSCHDDPEWGNCPAWSKCLGKAHEGRGWYSISDFIQKTLNLSLSAFSAQWENKSPSGGEKVFGNCWDENIHVLSWVDGGKFKSFYSVFHEKEIPKTWRRIGGVDFGANFWLGLFALEPKYGIWILYHEYFYNKDRLMSRHADEILKSPGIELVRRIYGDPSAKQGILDMNALLKKKFKRDIIWPGLNALIEGVDFSKQKMEVNPHTGLPGFYVLDTCIEFRKEVREWEHGQLLDGKVDLESFQEGNDHALDGSRYALYSYGKTERVSYRFASVEGV
jgi:hypothetical protein